MYESLRFIENGYYKHWSYGQFKWILIRTYGLLISMAMTNGDWNSDIEQNAPIIDTTENQV